MGRVTYANQRMIHIHRERATSDFLGIKNENWQAASRDLGAYALQLYLYLAANANNFNLALSPADIRQSIGMARSTYRDQFDKLVDKGYLVPRQGNTFDFYEVPQFDTRRTLKLTRDVNDYVTAYDHPQELAVNAITADITEINNNRFYNIDNRNIEEFVPLEEYCDSDDDGSIYDTFTPKVGEFTF